jgi:ATP-dependent DNA helicase DinG
MLYVPRDLPVPADDGYAAAAAARTLELLALTHGRAFLLFTSHRALRDAAARLDKLPYPRLVQGDAPRATLVDRFRSTPNAVLLGTGSFWEGVDVPGDALSLVIIDKLPFAPHTDPLVAARMQARARANEDPFQAVQLPSAAIALKQGFGRLIRRRDDRGIVAILDSRVVTKAYGRVFLDTLPPGLPRTSALEQVKRWWATVDACGSSSSDSLPDRSRSG